MHTSHIQQYVYTPIKPTWLDIGLGMGYTETN